MPVATNYMLKKQQENLKYYTMNLEVSYTDIRNLTVSNPKGYPEFPHRNSLLCLRKDVDYIQIEILCKMHTEKEGDFEKEIFERIWCKVLKNDKENEQVFAVVSSIPLKSKFHNYRNGRSVALSYNNILSIF
jgi:hypothetical protein